MARKEPVDCLVGPEEGCPTPDGGNLLVLVEFLLCMLEGLLGAMTTMMVVVLICSVYPTLPSICAIPLGSKCGRSYLYGAQYQTGGPYSQDTGPFSGVSQQNAPCAVCYSSLKGDAIMIPVCPPFILCLVIIIVNVFSMNVSIGIQTLYQVKHLIMNN